jgi:hypothetical protein
MGLNNSKLFGVSCSRNIGPSSNVRNTVYLLKRKTTEFKKSDGVILYRHKFL